MFQESLHVGLAVRVRTRYSLSGEPPCRPSRQGKDPIWVVEVTVRSTFIFQQSLYIGLAIRVRTQYRLSE